MSFTLDSWFLIKTSHHDIARTHLKEILQLSCGGVFYTLDLSTYFRAFRNVKLNSKFITSRKNAVGELERTREVIQLLSSQYALSPCVAVERK